MAFKTNNIGTGFIGRPIDPETGETLKVKEEDNYYICKACGQIVDMRDLGQVFHHEEKGHLLLQLDS